MRTRASSLVATVVVLVAVLVAVGAAPASAATVDDAGWWWRIRAAALPLPAPPTIPPGGLAVQGSPGGPLAIGAIRLADVAGGPTTLVLRVHADGTTGVADDVVLACPVTSGWTGGDALPWDDRPTADCSAPIPGDLADDATTVAFDLGDRPAGTPIDLVLVPATADGQAFDGGNGAAFLLAVEPPTPSDVVVGAAGSAPPATPPSTGAGEADPPSTTTPGAAPGPGRPAGQPAPRPVAAALPAPPAAGLGAAPAGAAAAPAGRTGGATVPARTVPIDEGLPGAGALLPLLLVLAAGPGAFLAVRRPWHPAPRVAADGPGPPLGLLPAAATTSDLAGAGPVGPAAEGEPVLRCRGVTVRFGGLQALGGVDLEVHQGEVVGLIGPNGAGKTTLMECISGFQRVTGGTIEFRGTDLLALAPGDRAGLGIGRTLQNVRLFPYLTVLDNIRVALHRHQSAGTVADAFRLPSARDEDAVVVAEAERILDLVGMGTWAEKFASELSYGTLRLLELGCMLALRPTFLLLDEPASGISQKETEALGPLLRRIKEATGASILVIEHDMPLVMGLSDRIYCLDAGTVLSTGTPQEIQDDPAVAEAYLGTPTEQRRVTVAPRAVEDTDAEVLLEIQGLDVHYGKVQVLDAVDLHVRRGERIALLGTNGAGKSTILKAASGLVTPTAGSIRWKGEDVTGMPAERLVRLGLGQVPGGRGLFPTLTVEENLRMGGYIYPDEQRVDAEVERILEYFPWIADRSGQLAGTLSGGEQQQLATARALLARPELLMIDELSLGLAPLVIERLMETVQRLCDEEGLTVVIVEQQASFALGYTDRAYFMEKGQVRYEGPSSGLRDRGDLLRSVFLAGASAGFAAAGVG